MMAWQLGVQLWLMRLANAPCTGGGGGASVGVRRSQSRPGCGAGALGVSGGRAGVQAKRACAGGEACSIARRSAAQVHRGLRPAGPATNLGSGVHEEAVVAVGVVARALQHDVVKVGQLVAGEALDRVLGRKEGRAGGR